MKKLLILPFLLITACGADNSNNYKQCLDVAVQTQKILSIKWSEGIDKCNKTANTCLKACSGNEECTWAYNDMLKFCSQPKP